MEQTERLTCLDALQKKLYAYACAENSLYLDAVTVAPKNTAEGRAWLSASWPESTRS